MKITRRRFISSTAAAVGCTAVPVTPTLGNAADKEDHWFKTRGAIVVAKDIETYDWPALANATGLSTLATHKKPRPIAAFLKTEAGQKFLRDCRQFGIAIEHELHAVENLLPRNLFDKDPAMFPMNEQGERVRDANLCVHSSSALAMASENAEQFTRALRSDTGRYFYWIDDTRPMCRCPKCRGYSDSDQALILENHLLSAIRKADARATLAHLAYANTLAAPTQVKPQPGVFLEFAPIERRFDSPFNRRDVQNPDYKLLHGKLLDALDANLEWFGSDNAQALEYWLDVSRFAKWKPERVSEIQWHDDVFRSDLATYARRGIRHVTTFVGWMDGDYVNKWGIAPVKAYGAGLARWRIRRGKPVEVQL